MTILVIFIYQSFFQYISFLSIRAIQRETWAKFGVGVKLIVILRHIITYFSINIRWHSQNVSSDGRKWLIKDLFPPSSCKKQINKQNSYLLLALLQSGSVPELDMHVSKHFLPGQFIHSGSTATTSLMLPIITAVVDQLKTPELGKYWRWISNTATTAMMLPIITAVVDQLTTFELGKYWRWIN